MMMVIAVTMIVAVGVAAAVMVPVIVSQCGLDSPEKENGAEDRRDDQKLADPVEYNRFHDLQLKAIEGNA
jgi:hypothetical protein